MPFVKSLSATPYGSFTRKWREWRMRNNGLLHYETIVQATSGEPEVPFLHYLCKANQKKFCFIRRFWKTTVLSGEKGNEIKKYLKISVIFALSRVEGSEWRYFTKRRFNRFVSGSRRSQNAPPDL